MIPRQHLAIRQGQVSRNLTAAAPMPSAARQRASIIVEEARDLMALTQAPLLHVSRYRTERPRLTLWNARYAPDRDLLALPRANAALAAWARDIAEVSTPVLDYLASRWAPTAAPPRIGFITDGFGLGTSPDDPCPSRSGWLLRQLTGACTLNCLLPFARDTPWPLIRPIDPAALPH